MSRIPMQDIVRQIHDSVKSENSPAREFYPDIPSRALDGDLAGLQSACQRLGRLRGAIGRMPAQPHTFRARVGAFLVSMVRRGLFWYTPQVQQALKASGDALERTMAIVRLQAQVQTALERRLEELERRQRALEPAAERALAEPGAGLPGRGTLPGTTGPTGSASPSPLPDSFCFALLDRFRGSPDEVREKLKIYVDIVRRTVEPADAPLLDVGCGRGEWLGIAAECGWKAMGIDSNRLAVSYCRERGFDAAEEDGIACLSRLEPRSVAVVTAFHVVEHWPFERALRFMDLAHTVLRPGGLLIVETPDAASSPVPNTDFWLDPTHVRPVPPHLLQFALEYSGFDVLKKLDLNAPRDLSRGAQAPDARGLPARTRDYALIGRRL